jgi:hypothetical protein
MSVDGLSEFCAVNHWIENLLESQKWRKQIVGMTMPLDGFINDVGGGAGFRDERLHVCAGQGAEY